jgi:beta-lactamase regulating signal transducer with metallopeptidase domain
MTAWLLTWLWQGSALAAVVAMVLRCAPQRNAATRHVVWCAALAAVAWLGWASSPDRRVFPVEAPVADPIYIYIPSAPDLLITVFIGMWAAITLVSLLRVLPGLHAVYAARDRCRPFPSTIEARLPLWLDANERGRRTELMICDVVRGATVLGFHRPCIAIPSSFVDALTCDELDQVILHEHAHVQRRDDWSRLAQTLLLSVLWVHPAALFVSRALSREREMACDEWVVARTGSPKGYARCLAHAAEVRMRMKGGPTLEPALLGSRHELVRRIDRILAIKDKARRSVSILGATAAACAMAIVSLPLQGVRFAEMVDTIFPRVTGPVMSVYAGTTAAFARKVLTAQPDPVAVRLTPDTPTVRTEPDVMTVLLKPEVMTVRLKPDTTYDAPIAPSLSARVFAGVYALPDLPDAPTADTLSRWNALAAPGVEIASAAKKTGLRVANGFSRAGVSLARRF